ncbi:MAG TPA: hypothetical protein VNU21_12570 [Usitatibacter sp.]|nr:hypothetical protein [Usitatibacter sp.]
MSGERILVAGGGHVGLAFACAARAEEIRVIDPAPAPNAPGEGYDVRVFAYVITLARGVGRRRGL